MNVDMTAVNKAIKCTRHVIRTVEELRYQMIDSAFFFKLDINCGHDQFVLDEDSWYVTVFYTHQGLRQFKRFDTWNNIISPGISPDPGKVEALQAVPPPTSTAEVRSFLGMTGFSSTFIPDYAVITTPLWKLTCKDVPFVWMKECQDAFQHLKDVLTQQTIMAYFDPNKDT